MTSPILDFLTRLHEELSSVEEGEVATYIPELAKADPEWFGICLVTPGGHVYEVGDTSIPFTIQSISKPFTYALALEDHGQEEVLAKVGVEPSGDAFNSISLEPGSGRPVNPMINAGAIATAGLIPGENALSRQRRMLHGFSSFAGRPLALDETVYQSESETGHRNRAIGHMLRNFDILTDAPDPTVELYFQQCSVSVTCRDLAVMAATLANQGINPLTGIQAVRGQTVSAMLSVMGSCGMYDWAGEWIYKVGMPAKSGVSGGILAVLPGQLGIGVFSPRLDPHGNSVRGIRVCEALSTRLDLHMFQRRPTRGGAIRLHYHGGNVHSRRVRTEAEREILREKGYRTQVIQLQGNLTFTNTEAAIHLATSRQADLDYLVFDCKRVLSINDTAARMIFELAMKLQEDGKQLVFARTQNVPLIARVFRAKLGKEESEKRFIHFNDDDPALEWCEERLLEAAGYEPDIEIPAQLANVDLFEGLTDGELEVIGRNLVEQTYSPGDLIIEMGSEAGGLYVMVKGKVSALVAGENAQLRRLATFSAGMVFGEMSLVDRSPRSASVRADSPVVCHILAPANLDRIGEEHPLIKIKLLKNLARTLSRRLREANQELSVFD